MNPRLGINVGVLLGVCGISLAGGGCASRPVGPPPETPRDVSAAEDDHRITSAELDELTRAFADRYVGLMYSVCDELKKDNPDPRQCREAQVLLLDCATNVYDIASNADAFTRVLDLFVVTSLLARVWIDDGRAELVFGQRGKALARAMLHARAEAGALAMRVLTVEQFELLDSMVRDWWEENPDMTRVSYVRFSNFAIGRGRSAASEVLAARGLFAEVGQAGQAVDEARLLGERMFYRLKREPTLLRWQAEAMKEDLVATPRFAATLADLSRLADLFERLPADVAAEREAIFTGLDRSLRNADATVAGVKAAMEEAHAIVASLEPASESLGEMLGTADALFARFDAWDRWTAEVRSRPFDIREHTEAVKQLAVAAEQINEALKTSGELLGSPDWDRRVDGLEESADGRVAVVADHSRTLLDAMFWRVCVLLGVLFAVLVLYRAISLVLTRQLLGPRAVQGPPP